MQLEEGTYQPAMDEVRLCDLLVNVVGRHARVDAPEKVIVDETILRLAVHEVATNATRYGQDGTPILVQAKLVTGMLSAGCTAVSTKEGYVDVLY